jgi:hypothetical protein
MSEATLSSRLIGVWGLVSYVDEQDGRENRYPLGTKPEGFLIYTPEGFVSAQLMKPGRRMFHSHDWHEGTPEEYQESGRGYIAYCGRYEVDEENRTVAHLPSVALLPNLIGGRHLRTVTLCEGTLTLYASGVPAENEPSVISRLQWRKVRSAIVRAGSM